MKARQLDFIGLRLFVLLVLCSAGAAKAAPQLEEVWRINEGFTSPESVVFYPKEQVFIVSNVNGYSKNGLGYLSKVSLQGELIAARYVNGLNGPTGMAIQGDSLYVADFDRLVKIDLTRHRIEQTFSAPDESPGLNDVTIDQNGQVYVSGSFSRAIYRLDEGRLTSWRQGEAFKDANGILALDQHLAFVGYHFFRLAYQDESQQGPLFAKELFDLESVEGDAKGGLFITGIGNRPIWYLHQGKLTAILSRDTFSADVEFVAEHNLLLVPSGQNRLFAFRVSY